MSKPLVPPIVIHNLHQELQRSSSSSQLPSSQRLGWSPKSNSSNSDRRKSIVSVLFGGAFSPRSSSPKKSSVTPRENHSGSPGSDSLRKMKTLDSPLPSPRGTSRVCLVREAFDIAAENNRFLILIFMRDLSCEEHAVDYVVRLNRIVDKVRELGGDILITTSAKKHSLPSGEDGQVTVIRDANNLLAKIFNIPMNKMSVGEKVSKFTSRLRSGSQPAVSPDYDLSDELLPAVVVIKGQTRDVIFKWSGEAHLCRHGKKIEPLDILRVVTYYFECETESESVKKFVSENSVQVLDALLKSHHKRRAFARFLEREVCQETLMFMERVEEIDNIMYYNRTDLDLDFLMRDIFDTFIAESSEMEVNIPIGIKRELIKLFSSDKCQLQDNPFKTAYNQVKRELRQGAFMRYIETEDFRQDGADLIAQFNMQRRESGSCGSLNLLRVQ